MGKVVTSQGLNEFVSTGKPTEEIKREPRQKPAAQAPPLEVKDEKPIVDAGKKEEPKAEIVADDIDDSQVKKEWPADVLDEITRKNAAINKKHREMKEAREAADEAEQFARTQYDRAVRAEARAAELEKQRGEVKPEPAKEPEADKPDPQKFYDDKGQFKAFEYAEALAAYAAEQAVAKDRKAQLEEKQQAEAQAAEELARTRIAKTIEAHPDFNEVCQAADVKTHKQLIAYLSASEHIGEVSYYLAKNPEYLAKINAMNPLRAIAEIGKLELTFEKAAASNGAEPPAPVAAKVSGAPAPIKPLSSATTVNTNTDPAKMSFKELRAYERNRNKRH